MPTVTVPSPNRAASFALRAAAWSLGLFGLLRLAWVETHALLPLTQLESRLAVALCGRPVLPIDVALSCSGADALALCVGAILAYPVRWHMRLAGAGCGVTLVLGLNTLRIGTLGRAAASPAWFEALHLYVWPAVLILAVAVYVFAWMRIADGHTRTVTRAGGTVSREASPVAVASPTRLTPRFIAATAVFLVLFTAASPLYLESAWVLAIAAFISRAAATTLHAIGVEAHATGNILWTSRGGFAVTQECISTPLIPVYLAAVTAYAQSWPRRAMGVIAAGPLFVGLGIARLLVVALPAALVASPLFLVHAFYQLLLAATVVAGAAVWRYGASRTALRRTCAGAALGIAVASVLGAPWAHAMARGAELVGAATVSGAAGAAAPIDDPQGALAFLPAFQAGLFIALWIAAFAAAGWRRCLAGAALLGLVQLATVAALSLLSSRYDFSLQVRDVRAWAIIAPLLVVLAVCSVGWPRPRRSAAAVAASSVAGSSPGTG